jgi:hypothetical protein
MASKTERLKRRAVETVRTAKPGRLAEAPRKRGYKVIGVSLYTDQAETVDRTMRELQRAGFAKANRSLVVQQAIDHLGQELAGKSPEELLRFFADRRAQAS